MKALEMIPSQRFMWRNQRKWRTFLNASEITDKDRCPKEFVGMILISYIQPNGKCGTQAVDKDYEFHAEDNPF